MAKEKFLLVSLNESKAKKLAQVISNDTSRKILDYLADKDGTESEIAKSLNSPISTIHYNLKGLIDGGLVVADEFHYSKKGKEVMHYKLANKYIIIAPRSTYGIKEKLKSILPVGLLIGATAGIIQLGQNRSNLFGADVENVASYAAPMMQKAAEPVMMESALPVTSRGIDLANNVIQAEPNIALWFLIGGVASLGLYLLIDYIKGRMEK